MITLNQIEFPNIRFVPTNCYSPNHSYCKSWVFPIEPDDNHDTPIHEANLADAFARVAADNGMSNNDVLQIFPSILRILKSKSQWAK